MMIITVPNISHFFEHNHENLDSTRFRSTNTRGRPPTVQARVPHYAEILPCEKELVNSCSLLTQLASVHSRQRVNASGDNMRLLLEDM